MRRITIVVVFVLLFTAAFSKLWGVYSHKFFDTTGEARWIWAQHRMTSNEPVAFFAARDFELPPNRAFTHLKVCGDPEYTVWINGRELAGAQTRPPADLDFYDISQLVRTGSNRIVIGVRAPQGNGGLLASIDISPELENWVATDSRWTIYRSWRPDLLAAHPSDLWSERPMIVGQPPIGRWNYLGVTNTNPPKPAQTTLAPKQVFPVDAQLPTIRTRQGIAVAIAEPAAATAFDFGFTRGRVRITLNKPSSLSSRAVKVRFANLREELGTIEWNLRTVVLAPGEVSVTTPEEHSFRYVMVFNRGATAEVIR